MAWRLVMRRGARPAFGEQAQRGRGPPPRPPWGANIERAGASLGVDVRQWRGCPIRLRVRGLAYPLVDLVAGGRQLPDAVQLGEANRSLGTDGVIDVEVGRTAPSGPS